MMSGEFAHELPALLGCLDFHDRRIAEIELRPRDARDERAGDSNARRFGGGVRALAHLEIPHRAADIDHARDPAAEIASENVVEMRFDPRDFVLVGADAGQIDHIRPGEDIGGLEEMNMCVDVTREDEFPGAINPPHLRRKLNVVRRSDGGD